MVQSETFADRYTQLRQDILSVADQALLDRPLSTFLSTSDKHLPQKLVSKRLRQILALDSKKLTLTPYFGERRQQKFVELLERVVTEAKGRNDSGDGTPRHPSPPAHSTCVFNDTEVTTNPPSLSVLPADAKLDLLPFSSVTEVSSVTWDHWRQTLNNARLGSEPLGRFASSLLTLPKNLWPVEVRYFTSRPLHEVRELPGCGPSRLALVLETLARVANAIDGFRSWCPFRVRVLADHIHDAASWVEDVLRQRQVPPLSAVRSELIARLAQQLDIDLGPELTALVCRRLGANGPSETLETIANELGLSRERIRQLTLKASPVFAVRWPEGKYLLNDLHSLLLSDNDGDESATIVRAVLDGLFCDDTESTRTSRADVLEAWERAGRANETPMTHPELLRWLGNNLPELSPNLAASWISQDALQCHGPTGSIEYFSHDEDDTLLHFMLSSREPIAISDLSSFVEGDVRNTRLRLERDPRFLEDEFKRIHASELLSLQRTKDRWHIELSQNGESIADLPTTLPVDCLCALIVTGMTAQGIVDATVWGVHRYVNALLQPAYGAVLPDHITPFILASVLVRHSDGAIRHMRRRRLRWDRTGSSQPARGKYGWINFVVRKIAVPITLDELDTALRAYYQDYERYVLSQITSDDDEDGNGMSAATIIPGLSTRLPAIIVPRGWSLNTAADNISEGVRMLATRIVSASGHNPFAHEELRHVPWLVSLCERYAYGQMAWSDDLSKTDGTQGPIAHPVSEWPPSHRDVLPDKDDIVHETPHLIAANIEGLLSRFI